MAVIASFTKLAENVELCEKRLAAKRAGAERDPGTPAPPVEPTSFSAPMPPPPPPAG